MLRKINVRNSFTDEELGRHLFFGGFFLVGVVGVVAVVGLVVHDQLPVDEVEAVGPGVERMSHHLTDQLRIQLRKVVDLKRLSRVL